MAHKAKTTAITTSSTTVVLPSREGAGDTGPQWQKLNFLNIDTTLVWLTQDSDTAVAEADENIPLPAGSSLELPYAPTAGIAITSTAKITAVGSIESPGSTY